MNRLEEMQRNARALMQEQKTVERDAVVPTGYTAAQAPAVFAHYADLQSIREQHLLPEKIIIDFAPELDRFLYDFEAVNATLDITVHELMDEVLLYLVDANKAVMGIEDLGNDLRLTHSPERGFEPGEGDRIAKAGMEFARQVFVRLKVLGLYTPEGLFPYVMEDWPLPSTILLKKHIPN